MFTKTTPAQIYGDIFFSTLLFRGLIGGCGASIGVFVSHSVLEKKYIIFFIENIFDNLEKREKHHCSA